jgi:hypothetical protein
VQNTEQDFEYWFYWATQNCNRSSGSSAAEAVAALCGASLRTVQHWRKLNKAPAWALRHLIYAATGVPAGIDLARSEWSGWRFIAGDRFDPTQRGPRGGKGRHYWGWALVSPTGAEWTPQILETCGLELALAGDLKREVERLRGPAQFLLPLS